MFECYYDGSPSGVHYGGGVPWLASPDDLRGGTYAGGRHLEQFELLLNRFSCEAACLGETIFERQLAAGGVKVRAKASQVADFYAQIFKSSTARIPSTILVIGDGDARLSLVPYACHEVAERKVMAIAGGDPAALNGVSMLAPVGSAMEVEHLWSDAPTSATGPASVADRTLAMAARWRRCTSTFLLADPEAAGRWIPAALRNGWAPVFGIPQAELVERMSDQLQEVGVVWGRQQDDQDFLALSRAGVGFQLIDPGRPPFPVIGEARVAVPVALLASPEPSDEELAAWARHGRVVSTIAFWTGMVRELECLYALADMLTATGLKAGLALTTESFKYLDSTPLALLSVPADIGGLGGQVEPLVASAGSGGMIESAAPLERFARSLKESVGALATRLGGEDRVPLGWWAVMDAPLIPRKLGRVKLGARPPSVKLRYRRRSPDGSPGPAANARRADLRSRVRESPLINLFEPIRPFDEKTPGGPVRSTLEAVRAAGFQFALTKAEFGQPPTLTTGVEGLSVINYTAGRWDGWTPFETVNALSDLVRAERALLRSGKPGWLLGGIDSCLWTFSGHVLDRGRELRDICRWMAEGGSSGKVINVTPRTAARYASVLAGKGLIRTVAAR